MLLGQVFPVAEVRNLAAQSCGHLSVLHMLRERSKSYLRVMQVTDITMFFTLEKQKKTKKLSQINI